MDEGECFPMRSIAVAVMMMMLCSCAATLGRGPFVVPIDSDPRGATVTQGGYSLGVTPCKVTLNAQDSVVMLELDGFAPREVDVGKRNNTGLVILGFLLWGPIELIVDACAGTWHRINTDPIVVPMSVEPQVRWERPKPPPASRTDSYVPRWQ